MFEDCSQTTPAVSRTVSTSASSPSCLDGRMGVMSVRNGRMHSRPHEWRVWVLADSSKQANKALPASKRKDRQASPQRFVSEQLKLNHRSAGNYSTGNVPISRVPVRARVTGRRRYSARLLRIESDQLRSRCHARLGSRDGASRSHHRYPQRSHIFSPSLSSLLAHPYPSAPSTHLLDARRCVVCPPTTEDTAKLAAHNPESHRSQASRNSAHRSTTTTY